MSTDGLAVWISTSRPDIGGLVGLSLLEWEGMPALVVDRGTGRYGVGAAYHRQRRQGEPLRRVCLIIVLKGWITSSMKSGRP